MASILIIDDDDHVRAALRLALEQAGHDVRESAHGAAGLEAYRREPALWSLDAVPEGFQWTVADDSHHNLFVFERVGVDGDMVVCVANFSAVPLENHRVGLPRPGRWREIINTDATAYGGSGVGNLGAFAAEGISWHGRPASARLRIPPLGALWLRPA